jgi:alpha-mannosidase
VRLEGRLLAGSPWLELVLSVDWRQRHELLRLEVPLRQQADRWAADTSGGVLERPATAVTARERARWEVAVISWMASCGAGGGLAVLLDGPQGVSVQSDWLGVSLLRAPTWPDPGADNGWVRQRLALMPCPAGWRQAEVPAQAQSFREPLWLRPAPAVPTPPHPSGVSAIPAMPPGVQLLGLRQGGPGTLVISLANLTPCRQPVDLGSGWEVLARLDGLDNPVQDTPVQDSPLQDGSRQENPRQDSPLQGAAMVLAPWQLASWRIRSVTASSGG